MRDDFESPRRRLTDDERRELAFFMGLQARQFGKEHGECPYDAGTELYNEWVRGWLHERAD